MGGTAEAAALTQALSSWPDVHVITSFAGRTSKPGKPPGEIRTGGFGGPKGLASYLRDQSIDAMIDATHPFADQMSHHAALAAEWVGIKRLRLIRPPWQKQPGDHWVEAIDAADAAKLLPSLGRRIFLTTGHKDLAAFAGLDDLWFLVRTIEPAAGPLPRQVLCVRERGPFDEAAEFALLKENSIDALVSKASGGCATYAKIAAARTLGLPVVMIQRPSAPLGPTVHDTAAALTWLRQVIG